MSGALAADLQAAIQFGNVEKSQLLARQLAEAKAKVVIRMDGVSNSSTVDADMIRCFTFVKCLFHGICFVQYTTSGLW